jgi:porin
MTKTIRFALIGRESVSYRLSLASGLAGVVLLLSAGRAAIAADEQQPFESADLVPISWSTDLTLTGFEEASESFHGLTGRDTLLGDAGGLRTSLGSHGIKVDVSATEFYQGVASGGIAEEFQFGGRNDYYVTMAAHKLGLWQGLLIDLHGETRYGEDLLGLTGAISPSNSAMLFPVPGESISALTGVKFTQILSEHLLVFAGKLNTMDGYLHPFAAGKGQTQFMNTSFVFPTILARTVPYSSLGAGFAVLRGPEPIFSLMVIDPVNNPTTSGFEQFFENGVSLFGEFSLPVTIAGQPGHQELIFSWSNRTVTALDDAAFIETPTGPAVLFSEKSHSWSLLYGFDQYLFVDPCNPQRGWGVFGQAALSDGNPNPIRWSFTAGIGGSSPLRTRPLDTFGVAYYFFQTSTELKQTLAPVLPVGNEQGVEVYYNIGVTKWFHITPNLQVIEPSNQTADTAVVVGVRSRLDF